MLLRATQPRHVAMLADVIEDGLSLATCDRCDVVAEGHDAQPCRTCGWPLAALDARELRLALLHDLAAAPGLH